MSDFITLSCPSCGARLQVNKEKGTYTCEYCGVDHLIRPENQVVVTQNSDPEEMKSIKKVMDKTNSEMAIKRLSEEIKEIDQKIAEVKAKNTEKSAGCVVFVIFFIGLFGLLAGIISLFQGETEPFTSGLCVGLPLLLIGSFLLKSNSDNNKIKEAEKLYEIDRLRKERRQKDDQISQHKKIIFS